MRGKGPEGTLEERIIDAPQVIYHISVAKVEGGSLLELGVTLHSRQCLGE